MVGKKRSHSQELPNLDESSQTLATTSKLPKKDSLLKSQVTPIVKKRTATITSVNISSKPLEVIECDTPSDTDNVGGTEPALSHDGFVHEDTSDKRPRKKQVQDQKLVSMMTRAFERNLQDDDKHDLTKLDDVAIYIEHIGRQLRSIKNLTQRRIMQNCIDNAIFKCEMMFRNAPAHQVVTQPDPRYGYPGPNPFKKVKQEDIIHDQTISSSDENTESVLAECVPTSSTKENPQKSSSSCEQQPEGRKTYLTRRGKTGQQSQTFGKKKPGKKAKK
jgi:hypothetical protein